MAQRLQNSQTINLKFNRKGSIMKLIKIKLEKNSRNEAWLYMEFDNGVKGAINTQNKAKELEKLLPKEK